MKFRLFPLFWFLVAGIFAMGMITEKAFGFDLWLDIQTNTVWDLGTAAAAGTSVALRTVHEGNVSVQAGQYYASALAEISHYRFLSLWGGGAFVPTSDSTLKAIDTGKIGLNLANVFAGFVNKPPAIINSLVVGPAISINLFSSPRVAIPSIDANYRFGS